MARGFDRDDPLANVRQMLREGRSSARSLGGSTSPFLGAVRLALFRLPARRREIIQRYDLDGESAETIRRDLALSKRQFFRDRRAALSQLSTHLLGRPLRAGQSLSPDNSSRHVSSFIGDAEVAGRAFARSMCQSGNAEGLTLLSEMAAQVRDPLLRADLLLELAHAATDYDDDVIAKDAAAVATSILREGHILRERSDYLNGMLARVRTRLADTFEEALSDCERAVDYLRRSVAADQGNAGARFALAEALGSSATVKFANGTFSEARAASSEACELIVRFHMFFRPSAIEILAIDAVLDAFLNGRATRSIHIITSLLLRCIDAGWSSTATKIGAHIVGLNCICGNYDEAIRWYKRMLSIPLSGVRVRERASLKLEAAHAYTISGYAREALSLLGYVRSEPECPRAEAPAWHASTAGALERLGQDAAALREARDALDGYAAQQCHRGMASAHRDIAVCKAKLGNVGAAKEHIIEAQRLNERYGSPYALLRTLVAKSTIFASGSSEREAIDLAKFLRDVAGEDNEAF